MWYQPGSFLAIGLSATLIYALPNPNLSSGKHMCCTLHHVTSSQSADKDLQNRQVNPDTYCKDTNCSALAPYTIPAWTDVFNACGCRQPNPTACKNQTCDGLHHVQYDNSTEKCTCEFGTGIQLPPGTEIPPYLYGETQQRDTSDTSACPDIVCGAGYVIAPGTCECESTTPSTASCPLIKCRGGYHPIYNATSGTCGCSLDCPTLMCTAHYNPYYNYSTKACTCELFDDGLGAIPTLSSTSTIKQLPPVTVEIINTLPSNSWVTKTPTATVLAHTSTVHPISTPPAAVGSCKGIYCISEKHPIWNATAGRCDCEWIDGFGPATVLY